MGKRPAKEPARVGAVLETLLARRGWAEGLAVGKLREAWAAVVGPGVAARSEPHRLANGTLTIVTDSGAWAAELTLLGAAIATKVDGFLGGAGLVKEVKVTAGRSLGGPPERGVPKGS